MRKYTKFLNLVLPSKEEPYDIEDFNTNAEKLDNAILERVYPVGSIFMSINPANPKDLFGGEWEAFGQGTLIGGISSVAPFNSEAGTVIGSNDSIVPYHNHTQSAHTHTPASSQRFLNSRNGSGTYPTGTSNSAYNWVAETATGSATPVINYAGTSGNTVNANIPRTTLVHIWERIS